MNKNIIATQTLMNVFLHVAKSTTAAMSVIANRLME